MEEKTCIRFVPAEPRYHVDYIEFIRKDKGCHTAIAKQGGRQTVNLGSLCETVGIVAHELGHTIGFWHEQSRPDRDHYVTLLILAI